MIRNGLRLKTYDLIGGRAYDMDNTTFDYTQLAAQFGVFVHHVDQLELYLRAEKQDPDRVLKIGKEFSAGKTVDAMPDWVMDRSIRLYLSMRDMVEEYQWDFVGIKCQLELINNYCSPCLGMAQLNDDGWVTACECDTSGALSSYMLSMLANEPAYIGDISGLDFDTQMLRLANCGAMAMKLARPDVPVRLTRQLSAMGKTPGICTSF